MEGTIVLAPELPVHTIHLISEGADHIAVDERAGRAVVAGRGINTSLSILDTFSNRLIRTTSLNNGSIDALATMASTGHTFALISNHAPCHLADMIDTRTGSLLRIIQIPLNCHAVVTDQRSNHVFVASIGPTRPDGIPRGVGSISMIDGRSGILLARVPVGFDPWAMAVDHTRQLVVVTNLRSDTVSVLDARTGRVVRTMPVVHRPTAVAIDEKTGHAFVLSEVNRSMSMLDVRTGKILRTSLFSNNILPMALAVDTTTKRVVVAGSGRVSLFDAASDTMLYTVEVGGDPLAVAVDEHTGHAFVTDTGSKRSLLLHRFGKGQLSWAGEWEANNVSVLDTRTGMLLHMIHTDSRSGLGAIAVDERVGHVFVVNPQGDSVSVINAAH